MLEGDSHRRQNSRHAHTHTHSGTHVHNHHHHNHRRNRRSRSHSHSRPNLPNLSEAQGTSSSGNGDGSGNSAGTGIGVDVCGDGASTNININANTSAQPQTEAGNITVPFTFPLNAGQAGQGRKKLWQCVYPGCTEPPKTHYNCFSHVWDSHIRRSLTPDNPLAELTYKRITDRTAVKELCRQYIIELSDDSKRRARPQPQPQPQSQLQFQPQLQQLPQPPQLFTTGQIEETTTTAIGKSYALDYDGVTNITISPEGLARLSVCGEVFAEHGFLQRSDVRFKEDIKPIGGALERVLQITGKTFRYRSEAGEPVRMGFIAQELEQVVPDAVHRDEHGLSVDIVCLVPLLLEALKEVYSQTVQARSERAIALNEALRDAMAKTQSLNEKLDAYRSDSDYSSSDSTGSGSSDSDSDSERRRQYSCQKLKRNKNMKSVEMGSLCKGNEDRNNGSNNTFYDEETLVGDATDCTKKCVQKEEDINDGNNSRVKRHFRYRFSFGPPTVTFLFCALFLCGGFALLTLFGDFVFAWAYSFFVSTVLGLSLLLKAKEIRTSIKNRDFKVYWHTEDSLNVYLLSVAATFGLICTLILGTPSFICMGVCAFTLLVTGVISAVFHHKFRIRVESILTMGFGVLVFLNICFVFVYMAQRKKKKKATNTHKIIHIFFFLLLYYCRIAYKSGFKGHSGLRVDVPVRVGEKIIPIHIKDLPWNCFSPKIELSDPLPDGLTLNQQKSPPTIEGEVSKSFAVSLTSVSLVCNSYQRLECGTLAFKQCTGYTDKQLCKANMCSWCPLGDPPYKGLCGFCNNGTFSDDCVKASGRYPSVC